ncbi:hypothetical protein [Flavivirga algicola]|uniref:Uncharacterized protein n=1 Tax=Flavivirga algicola TaxID=2729136 RepID=A0ABX1RYT2_9FLAO|nr:hypothetical protein [Flavivirga algicola]NMH87654.1 hypothetical protein [Flavivirga algicola]
MNIIILCLFVVLIVGLIKPELVIRWDKKPTRFKVFGFWVITIVFFGILNSLAFNDEGNIKSVLYSADSYIKNKEYDKAVKELEVISEDDVQYVEAKRMLLLADSLNHIQKETERISKELEAKREFEKNKTAIIEQLKRELNSIHKGIDFSSYSGKIESLQIELILFGSWATIISENEESTDNEIKKLTSQLKSKVKKIQAREFPRLRKEYVKAAANLLWENDIEVTVSGKGNININFTAGIFAGNKNKKNFHNEVKEALKMFRFSQARYRWYTGEREYTYWTIQTKNDTDLYMLK